jgi:hypothetical protein
MVVKGATSSYRGAGAIDPVREILFCATCAGVLAWRSLRLEDGRRRMGVNVRLAPPEAVACLPIEHFDGLDSFTDFPPDGCTVGDLWS